MLMQSGSRLTWRAVRGKDAWLAAVSDWLDAADDWRILIGDVSDLGGDQVLVESRNAIRGKGSRVKIDQGHLHGCHRVGREDRGDQGLHRSPHGPRSRGGFSASISHALASTSSLGECASG